MLLRLRRGPRGSFIQGDEKVLARYWNAIQTADAWEEQLHADLRGISSSHAARFRNEVGHPDDLAGSGTSPRTSPAEMRKLVQRRVRRLDEFAGEQPQELATPDLRENLGVRLSRELQTGHALRDKARMARGEDLLHACQDFIAWGLRIDELVGAEAPVYLVDLKATRAPWAIQGKAEALKNMDARLRVHSEIVKKLEGRG